MTARLAGPAAAILGTLSVLGWTLWFAVLHGGDRDAFYRSVQEDGALEWATFWAFVAAGALLGLISARAFRRQGFLAAVLPGGLALLCLVVAGEEISWGQRVFGFLPPVYFLENNFQQELNVHNVMRTSTRKLSVQGLLVGYGILLPLLGLIPAVRRWVGQRLALPIPHVLLLPAFALTLVLHVIYPWSFTGELVELLMGLSLTFAALPPLLTGRHALLLPGLTVGAVLATLGAGSFTAAASRAMGAGDPERLRAAETELDALRRDFITNGGIPYGEEFTRCNLSKRLYTFVEEYERGALYEGEFAGLVAGGLPEERATYFIDPWNSPYWVRDRCDDDGRRQVFIYSFGPNSRRDSTRHEILGDDVGVIIRRDPGYSGD